MQDSQYVYLEIYGLNMLFRSGVARLLPPAIMLRHSRQL